MIPGRVMRGYYQGMEFLAAAAYRFPGRKVKAIGVTGTKGKSTTVFLITRILEEAGLKVASSSSIEFRFNKESIPNTLKMGLTSRWTMQRFLRAAFSEQVDYVIIECTSEGLAQARVNFVHFVAAVFTNLAPEHIQAHGSYENYRAAKRRLFELLDKNGVAVINKDDGEAGYFAKATEAKTVFYSLKGHPGTIATPLIGRFNQYNALAAWTLCKALGVKEEVIARTLESISVIPGRLEEIKEGQDYRVFVDYAHNPSSLHAALTALSKIKGVNKKLIVITGAQGGGRDKWKRPEMGKIAARLADIVLITNEDPYKEDPRNIIEDVYEGARQESEKKTILKIPDRRVAMKRALQLARKDDIVLIAGKGSETVMETAHGKIPWNEREMVAHLLSKMT